jgi:formate dehydrogenase iron-sulfur subunit
LALRGVLHFTAFGTPFALLIGGRAAESSMSKAILFDATLCVNCKLCEQACAEKNGLRYDEAIQKQQKLSEHKLTVVLEHGDKFMRRLCMNCADPACASVCPVGAFEKSADGPVTYDEEKCMGCRYCMLACPFGVPSYEWQSTLPRVRKCDMCAARVAAGRPTSCAEICPTGANKFGEREELLAEARQRIQANPQQYVNHIYGETEVGGTAVLLLSSVPFAEFGYQGDLLREPLPLLTYRVLSRIPDLVALGGLLLGGIWWLTSRREEVALAEAQAAKNTASKE